MIKHLSRYTFLCALAVVGSVQASPSDIPDQIGNFLAEQRVLTQIQQVSQSVTTKTSELVVNALGFLGVPYRRGGNTAETGFDCSGFVKAVYEQTIGLVLPRRAEQQAASTEQIDKAELKPGDLVFFNTMRRAFSHVGIYIGDGKFVHSPKPGAQVRVENMDVSYWKRRFDGARRILASAPELVFTPTTRTDAGPTPP